MIGADLEFLVTDRLGFQLGGGFLGYGGGINYHFKPSIKSSFVSLQYWNQGLGDYFALRTIGPNYVYRSKKWFTFQIGVGAPLEINTDLLGSIDVPPVILLYSIGIYLPF